VNHFAHPAQLLLVEVDHELGKAVFHICDPNPSTLNDKTRAKTIRSEGKTKIF
jgi:hypothetical protein